MLLYSSLCTKGKKRGGGGRQLKSKSAVQMCTNQCARNREQCSKNDAGLPQKAGVLGNDRKLGAKSQIKQSGMSYGAMHPWEGHNPGKYGMFTVVLYCFFFIDSFVFADKPISGLVALLCSIPASMFRFTLSRYNWKKQKKTTTQ